MYISLQTGKHEDKACEKRDDVLQSSRRFKTYNSVEVIKIDTYHVVATASFC